MKQQKARKAFKEKRKEEHEDTIVMSEIYGVEEMQEFGKSLAETHVINLKKQNKDSLLSRLEDNEKTLRHVHSKLIDAVADNQKIVPAAEWLLDNFYLLENQIRLSKRDLPKKYSKELPQLVNEGGEGIPRVYDIALQRISHCDGLVDAETLPGFLIAYQKVSILSIGELWAMPIMLRLSLIENISCIAKRILKEMEEVEKAVSWADKMIKAGTSDSKNLVLVLADLIKSGQPLAGVFVAEMVRLLKGRGEAFHFALSWIDQQLNESGAAAEILVQQEMQRLAIDQVSISNSIRSLRTFEAYDWKDFFESISTVEKKLCDDPSSVYDKMDFPTRNMYRGVIESTAKKTGCREITVAEHAVRLAEERCGIRGFFAKESHVGYYLVDAGYELLVRALSERRFFGLHSSELSPLRFFMYATGILSASSLVAAAFILLAYNGGMAGHVLFLLVVPLFIAAAGFSVSIIDWIAARLVKPFQFSRMDYSAGIPAFSTTLVVLPSMLSSMSEVDSLAGNLEVGFLANRTENLYFGLLTDYCDSEMEIQEGDFELLEYAKRKIRDLNMRYSEESPKFYLFHRGRKWNPAENKWMGYERKRGKLSDINELILTGKKDCFDSVVGDLSPISRVKYIITLDSDTALPRDSVMRLAGTMAHPLNRPCYDEDKKRITSGYCILQPRIMYSITGASRSVYSLITNYDEGVDTYTRTVSNIYQDLFKEGSYIGKGIYDVEAFSLVLKERFPENRILSHDLVEGCYARSGFVSDILLYERAPVSYLEDVSRRIRWLRGDWQVVQWSCSRAPSSDGCVRKTFLSGLSRWKIADNVRRSVSSLAMVVLFIAGWMKLDSVICWNAALIGMLILPSLFEPIYSLCKKPENIRIIPYLQTILLSCGLHIMNSLLNLVNMVYESYYSSLAIFRTCWRLIVSRRNLLEWDPSVHTDTDSPGGLSEIIRVMWFAPVFSVAVSTALLSVNSSSFILSLPVLLLWFFSPLVVFFSGFRRSSEKDVLSAEQAQFLRVIARKTWAFFDTFVAEEDNWLPPDNIQENPDRKTAHRTSPTNIGLSLLSSATAFDLCYISQKKFIKRTEATISSIEKLSKYKNHLYNWYDTITLEPLLPLYVSTVDSGNLAGSLLALYSVLQESADVRIFGDGVWQGLYDTCLIIDELSEDPVPLSFLDFKKELHLVKTADCFSLHDVWICLCRLDRSAQQLVHDLSASRTEIMAMWAQSLVEQCRDYIDDIETMVPWIDAEGCDAEGTVAGVVGALISLHELSLLNDSLAVEEDAQSCTILTKMRQGSAHANERLLAIHKLMVRVETLMAMDFSFLYDEKRRLLTIGYMVASRRKDSGYYDLLASEARLTSFIAISQGQIPQENWFALGRLLADTIAGPLLVSWTGSMFEYLMPMLMMPSYKNSLLHNSCKGAVECQIEYGRIRGVPWGISESGYNLFDTALNYQYRAFGIPALGMKTGLHEDLVVSPYASALALMVKPKKACQNLQRLAEEGIAGTFGFYEAVDYTAGRIPSGQKKSVVKSFMAHHQAMSLLSISSCLLGRKIQARFEAMPAVRATVLLLEERMPQSGIRKEIHRNTGRPYRNKKAQIPFSRIIKTYDTPVPEVQALSNGRYHVMITNAGGGYSKWSGLSLTRWQEDITLDNRGSFLYIRDIKTGYFWSNTYQPTLKKPVSYEAVYSEGRAEFRRRDRSIECYTEIVVSPEDDVEVKRVKISNRSRKARMIEVTSYAEVVIDPAKKDIDHPCFNNLFMQSEIIPDKQTILFKRRPRETAEEHPVMMHLMSMHETSVIEASYETSRQNFIGRGNTLASPKALLEKGPLSGTDGSVLDPIASIRRKFIIEGESTVIIDIVTGVSANRSSALFLSEKYRNKRFANRAFELSRTHSQIILQQINASESDARLFSRMLNSIVYASRQMRTAPAAVIDNRKGQSSLWGYSISGDLPIVLLLIKNIVNIGIVRQMLQAHAYWHNKGIETDLVIWNEDHSTYRQRLQEEILSCVASDSETSSKPGGVFVRLSDQISHEHRLLFQSAARIVISDINGTLEEQLSVNFVEPASVSHKPSFLAESFFPLASYQMIVPKKKKQIVSLQEEELSFANGIGGFSADGKEYVVQTSRQKLPPLPWVNVIANSVFGTVVSETGMAYTWSENAHEFRLSPWYNDPVSDISGEALYLRDDESGAFWSLSSLPSPGDAQYTTRHGFGYSIFEHSEHGIATELCVFVSQNDPVKFMKIKICNLSGRLRKLSLFSYSELVLGDQRDKNAMQIVTGTDAATGSLFARNWYNTGFEGRTVFLDLVGKHTSRTGNRTEFLGRNGTLANPDAMKRTALSGQTGSEYDPCFAVQSEIYLVKEQEVETSIFFGSGRNSEDAVSLIKKYRAFGAVDAEFEKVKSNWSRIASSLQVETPDASINVLANGWLVYQTLTSRMWGRSGYYQSGGAFGFRDQLQDAMALVHIDPQLVREHLILCASHQFREGDAQHWWHPPHGHGVRSHCSDDYLWLPLAVSRYVDATGDAGVLSENVFFLEGEPIGSDEESRYFSPTQSSESGTLFEHCRRSLLKSKERGAHGLPLMKSGDWNDGMNKVGCKGLGESVWLGFFLYDVLTRFSRTASVFGDGELEKDCIQTARRLREAVEKHGWDGSWYLRAWFDDGEPLGSDKNEECRIDSIAQSWAVLSGLGDAKRTRIAMASLEANLVSPENRLIKLLDPPFDESIRNPGYIKGYVPGIRENGGQYTQAAIWAAMAFARLGESEKAWSLTNMLNPVSHSDSSQKIDVYKVEPYVMSADVYSVFPHTGRGGWSWYTGSAGWMYRHITESLLGLNIRDGMLTLVPCIPKDWRKYKLHYRYKTALYHISIIRRKPADGSPSRTVQMVLDGGLLDDLRLPLKDDRKEHDVKIEIE